MSAHVPEDLLVDILARLSAKSLIRFKVVCKRWFKVIQETDFVDKHYWYESRKRKRQYIVKHDGEEDEHGLSILCFSTAGHYDIMTHMLPQDSKISEGETLMLGPVRGIVCFYNDHCRDWIILCNPATRQLRRIDFPPVQPLKGSNSSWVSNMGFGFDELKKDHKVIKFVCSSFHRGGLARYEERAQLYSLKKDSWKDVGFVGAVTHGLSDIKSLMNPIMEGRFFWFASRDGDEVILSYDFTHECFACLGPLERDFAYIRSMHSQLTTIDDKLTIVGSAEIKLENFNEDEGQIATRIDLERVVEGIRYSLHFRGDLRPIGIYECGFWFFESNIHGNLVLYREGLYSNIPISSEERLQIAYYVESKLELNQCSRREKITRGKATKSVEAKPFEK